MNSSETGFICNSSNHWLTIRKVNGKWYNLNSTNKEGPEIISDFYLRLVSQAFSVKYIKLAPSCILSEKMDTLYSLSREIIQCMIRAYNYQYKTLPYNNLVLWRFTSTSKMVHRTTMCR